MYVQTKWQLALAGDNTFHYRLKWFQCWIVQYRDAPVGGAKGQWNHQVILKRLARSAPKAYQYTFDAISLFKFRIMKPSEMHFSAIFFFFENSRNFQEFLEY